MKLLFFLSLKIAVLFPIVLWAQSSNITDTTKSMYQDLPILKDYAVSSSSLISADTSWFKLNNKDVDEKTYRKFTQFADNINKCKPCVLLSYDTSDNLVYKRITYGDCVVGYSIEYYPNGKTKVIGHHKENSSGNWENLFERGYCRQDGFWTYFNNKGIVTYTEIWKEGKLIKKVIAKDK